MDDQRVDRNGSGVEIAKEAVLSAIRGQTEAWEKHIALFEKYKDAGHSVSDEAIGQLGAEVRASLAKCDEASRIFNEALANCQMEMNRRGEEK